MPRASLLNWKPAFFRRCGLAERRRQSEPDYRRVATSDFGKSVSSIVLHEWYWAIFEAIVFTIVACGFKPRCSLENLDSGALRIEKLRQLIASCRLGIHDLSRVELDPPNRLPRFNMPFELGLDAGARAFGGRRLKRKRFLVLD